MSTLSKDLPYYQQLSAYIKGQPGNLRVFGNPGIPFNDAESYLQVANNLTIYEGPFWRTDPNAGTPSFVDTIKSDSTVNPGYP